MLKVPLEHLARISTVTDVEGETVTWCMSTAACGWFAAETRVPIDL
jgi:hypothetical protein